MFAVIQIWYVCDNKSLITFVTGAVYVHHIFIKLEYKIHSRYTYAGVAI